MSTKNVTLHDENGNVLLPATKTSRVTDANGTNLDTLLQQAGQVKSISVNGTTQTIDANGNVDLSITQTQVTVGTTTTGAAGSSASVTNSGTATAPILNFTIPQGAQGIQGIQGPQGERGPQGNTGVQVDSVASIIHSIDPTATYAAADVAGADAVQGVLSEVTELSEGISKIAKQSSVLLAIDKTDLTRGYYYDNTNGEKVVNNNCFSTLIDIPANTKEINVIWGGPGSTVAFYGIAIYDAPIAELTDENISDHFIKGFTGIDLLEVSRIIVNDSYKSIAVTIGNSFSSQVLFNALESSVHYGSRLLDVFYLNDNYTRSMVGKSVYLKTLDKTTGIVSFRDPITVTDYNVTSTIKKGKELLLSKKNNYVYLGVLVDWDIVDYNFSNISQTADNTFVLSTPKSAEGQKFFDMIYNKKYHQTGNTTVNGDGIVSGFDCVWEDGTPGHVEYNAFDSDVLEYRSSIVTYGGSYAVYYGLKTFDEYGNITSETGLEIRVV